MLCLHLEQPNYFSKPPLAFWRLEIQTGMSISRNRVQMPGNVLAHQTTTGDKPFNTLLCLKQLRDPETHLHWNLWAVEEAYNGRQEEVHVVAEGAAELLQR